VPEGLSIRAPASTAPLRPPNDSVAVIYTEAWERGWSRTRKEMVWGGSAGWIWAIADRYLVGAIQVADIWRARQHLWGGPNAIVALRCTCLSHNFEDYWESRQQGPPLSIS
jgi:hypothetical protein